MKKTRRKRIAARWRRPWIGAAALAVLAVLVIAGCGGSSSSSSSSSEESTTSSSSGSSSQAAGPGHFEISEEARACLKEQGFEPPEGGPPAGGAGEGGPPAGFGAGGANGGKFKEAFEACGIEGPTGNGKPGGAPTNSAAFRTSVKNYVACVRENGYEMPEPNLSGEGPIFSKSEVNQEDPKFKAASKKCESALKQLKGGETES
jgi:hypothetical protein